jgi:hypothetical protein
MSANAIVKACEICKDRLSGLLPRGKTRAIHTFTFEGAEKAFPGNVVRAVSDSAPAAENASFCQFALIP